MMIVQLPIFLTLLFYTQTPNYGPVTLRSLVSNYSSPRRINILVSVTVPV